MKINKYELKGMIIENQPKHKIASTEGLAKRMGVSTRTMYNRLSDPCNMKVSELFTIFTVCRFTSKQIVKLLLGMEIEDK